MEEHSGTRTGRWRRALRERSTLSLEERLYRVIRSDIESGELPAGALLPSSERVAQELALQETEVQSAFARLLVEGLLAVRNSGQICIASQGQAKTVGDETQRRFEASLFKAMREAQARGLSSTEASGMFKAALQRLGEIEKDKRRNRNREDDNDPEE
jgi:DNA-binding transcriptional regulator YhcF (GntR family)